MRLGRFITIIAVAPLLWSCDNINDISSKPARVSGTYDYQVQESDIGVKFSVDLSEVETVINGLLDDPITGDESGEFSETYTMKTKDPLHNPHKWIKKRDPFYQPSKWIKKCVRVFGGKHCLKTKNPTYHPNKWIKTKNPLYHPNKWMYTSAQADIGYNAEYSISLSAPVSFEAHDENKLKIEVPISVDGSAGFSGDLAKISMLDSKNYEADATFTFIVGVEFGDDWCPVMDVDANIDWQKGPKIEVVGDVWLDLNLAAKFANLGIEPKVKETLESMIDCDPIKETIAKTLVPSSVQLSEELNGLYLDVNPVSIYKPRVSFFNDDMSIDLAAKFELAVNNESGTNTPRPLPPLSDAPDVENLIKIALPIMISYKELEKELNAQAPTLTKELNNKLSEIDSGTVKSIDIDGFEIYPNNDRIVVGVDFGVETGIFLNPTGVLYLTSKPEMSADNKLSLTDIQVNSDFENSAYDAALGLLKNYVEKKLEEVAVIDLGEQMDTQVSVALDQLKIQLAEINEVSVDIIEPTIDLSSDIVNVNDSMIKPIIVSTGLDIRINPIELTN